jgi:hypothetical protein
LKSDKSGTSFRFTISVECTPLSLPQIPKTKIAVVLPTALRIETMSIVNQTGAVVRGIIGDSDSDQDSPDRHSSDDNCLNMVPNGK